MHKVSEVGAGLEFVGGWRERIEAQTSGEVGTLGFREGKIRRDVNNSLGWKRGKGYGWFGGGVRGDVAGVRRGNVMRGCEKERWRLVRRR